MPQRNEIIDNLESINGAALSDAEKDEIELWQKGRALSYVVNSPGWDVVREMLQSYVTKELDRLMLTDPGDRDAVLATHAIAFAASRIYSVFMEDVQNCINSAQRAPEVLKSGLRKASPVPPDSL